MTRRRVADWVLIVALTGSWALVFARGIEDGLQHARGQLRIGVSSAAGASVYPIAIWGRPAGDQIVAVDGQDLRGSSALHFYDRATKVARERGSVALSVLGDGGPSTVDLTLTPSDYWWLAYLLSAVLMATALILVAKASAWHLARRYFVASWCIAVGYAVFEPSAGPGGTAFEATLAYGAYTVGCALLVWNLQDFSESAPPIPKWHRAFALITGALFAANYVVRYLLPYSGPVGDFVIFAPNAWLGAAGLLALTRAYRCSGPLERRQIRWIVLGFYIAMLGLVIGNLASLNRFDVLGRGHGDVVSRLVRPLSGLAVPLGMLAAVVGHRWLDIDRLISAAASYTIVGFCALGIALAMVPRVANATAPVLGLDPASAQWLLTMALVLAAVPVHLYLRPRLDRRMFRERHTRMSGFARLLDEIGHCSGAEELWKHTSERLDELLEPRSLVVYVRADERFAPRFVRGREASPGYEADSVLARALERRGRPLAADSSELDPFDRAALETLGVALIVPVRAAGLLVAFGCLGPKRSGDIYTPEEKSQLGAVAVRCAEVLGEAGASRAVRHAQVFRREGDLWTIASRGKEIRLRDMRGLQYLAALLREPGREFPALELVRAASGLAPVNDAAIDPELRVARQLGDPGPVLDAQARAEYRERVTALDAELADAERCSDLGRLERANEEREVLLAELESSARGRRSATGSDSERARVAVTKVIKVALERIAEAHPELGAHLAATVRRGHVCAYEPDPRDLADWEI